MASRAAPNASRLLKMAAHDHVVRWKGLPRFVAQSARRGRASETRRRSFAVKPPLPLHHIPKTSFNVSLTSERTFAMTKLPLEDLKSMRRTAGTTLNDVYLCVCAGALRRYLSDRGELPARPLVASVPISTDPNVARMSGNRVDNLYVSIGTDIADPVQRLEHIRSMTAASKEVRRVLGHDLFERRADFVPPQIYHSAVRLWTRSHIADRVHPPLNVVLSNVAGPQPRIFFGSMQLEALYSIGPSSKGSASTSLPGAMSKRWVYPCSVLRSAFPTPGSSSTHYMLHSKSSGMRFALNRGQTTDPLGGEVWSMRQGYPRDAQTRKVVLLESRAIVDRSTAATDAVDTVETVWTKRHGGGLEPTTQTANHHLANVMVDYPIDD